MNRKSCFWLPLLALLISAPVLATTPNQPEIDGVVPPDPGSEDWESDELSFIDPVADGAWGPNNDLQGLWVTWDDEGITFAVTGQLWDATPPSVGANSVNLYIDIDYGEGTGIANLDEIDQDALAAISRNFWRPLSVGAGFGCDWGYTCWAGQFDLGFLDISDPQAPVNLLQGLSGQGNPVNESPEGVKEGRDLTNYHGYEVFVPWSVFYPGAENIVPAGTRIAVVVAQVGGGDSLSPESMPDQAIDRQMNAPIVFTVDSDGDGRPDADWPPAGSISGTVELSQANDTLEPIEIVALLEGSGDPVEVGRAAVPVDGGDFTIDRLPPGGYQLQLESRAYVADPITGIDLAENEDLVLAEAIQAIKVNGGVDFTVSIVDGPQAVIRTQEVFAVIYQGEQLTEDSVIYDESILPGDPLVYSARPVQDGDYKLLIGIVNLDALPPDEASFIEVLYAFLRSGYKKLELDITVANDSVTDLGDLELSIIRGTHLAFFDDDGQEIFADFSTVSLPDLDFFAYMKTTVAFVDEDGEEAFLDDSVGGDVTLSFSTMDPNVGSEGDITFWSFADTVETAQPLLNPALFDPAPGGPLTKRASFFFTDDVQEVVRLVASHPTAEDAVFEVGVLPILPDHIVLAAEDDQMVAGGQIGLSGQLEDVSDNPVPQADVTIRFLIDEPGATTRPSSIKTLSDGSFGSEGNLFFVSETSGEFTLTAFAVVAVGDTVFSEPLDFAVSPDVPDHLELSGSIGLDEIDNESRVVLSYEVLLADRFGNAAPIPGANPEVNPGPPEIVETAPRSVTLDDETARGSFEIITRAGTFGVVDVNMRLPGLPTEETNFAQEILFGLAAADEAAPETDENHNSDPGFDLTTVFAWVESDTLVVTVPFTGNFNGGHMAMALEYKGDAEGAPSAWFGFDSLIPFGHAFLPDLVFTYKVQADDYGDLRRLAQVPGNTFEWDWYDFDLDTWHGTDSAAGNNAKNAGTAIKGETDVVFKLPMSIMPGITAGLDTLRIQVYVMQNDNGERPALDSAPHDDTVDMVPPEGAGPWFDNLPPSTTLSNYAEFIPQELPSVFRLVDVGFAPAEVTQGESALLTASAEFLGENGPSPLQFFANLSRLGGGDFAPMTDDGQDGDAVAGDGVYSVQITVAPTALPADVNASVLAVDLASGQRATATATLSITGEPELEAILTAEDASGDDHGPNLEGQEFLFYEYPTNGVFFDGVFDLLKLEVFDAGADLLFRVTLRELTSPSDLGAADWNATFPRDNTCPQPGTRTDLNLQNIVLLIDAADGGSIKLPQSRWADVATQDAWEYAVVADGWWKGVVQSNGSSSSGSWSILKEDQDYSFCANATENTIDMFAKKVLFGLDEELTEEQVKETVRSWDLITMLSGHDGDSNDDNWGGVRWVDEGSAEWQFGGGKQGESNRERDPNIMDILTRVGEGKIAGRTQEEQLDYLAPEAQRRFEDPDILVAVELEAEQLIDTAPPRVTFLNDPARALTNWQFLRDAPVAVIASIQDQKGVKSAQMLWRGLGEPRSANRVVPMGLLRSDLANDGLTFIADVPWDAIADPSVTNLVERELPGGGTEQVRYIVISFDAEDVLGNVTDPDARQEYVVEVPITPKDFLDVPVPAEEFEALLLAKQNIDGIVSGTEEELTFDLPEGSRVRVGKAEFLPALRADAGATVSLRYEALARDALDLQSHGGDNETVLGPGNRFLGTARRIEFEITGSDFTVNRLERLSQAMEISLHFPRYFIRDERPENLQLFHWNELSQRWTLVGGHAEVAGSTITANVVETGVYGVFTKSSNNVQDDRLISGLQLTPNPFSPNGDGLYDVLNISYVLPEDEVSEAIVEIFDMRGVRVRTLKYFGSEGTTNRTLGVIWDGHDEGGRPVPMGIYICRVEVQGVNIQRWERATEAVAVVR